MTTLPDDIPDDLALDAAPPEAAGAAAPLVADDVPCRRCGYDLRGLPIDGACPECGTAVAVSFRDNLIRSSDPAWIGRLRVGASLILTYFGLLVVLTVGGSAAVMVAVLTGGPAAAAKAVAGPWSLVLGVGGLAAYAVNVAGCYGLTSRDPGGIGEGEYGTVRRVVRVSVWFGAARWVGTLLATPGAASGEFAPVLAAVSAVGQLSVPVTTVAMLVYLGRLARRLPDPRLGDRVRMLTYGLGVPLSITAATTCAILVVAPGGRPPAGSPFGFGVFAALGCVGSLCGLTTLGFGVVYVVTLVGFGERFKEQAALARQTWAAGGVR